MTAPDESWTTESRNPATSDLDRMSPLEVVTAMHVEDGAAVRAVGAVLPEVARAVEAIAERMRRGGRLVYAGAGTSGRLGVLDAVECPPTFSTPPGRVVGLIAGGTPALTRAVEGAEDDEGAGRADVAGLSLGARDALVGIAASGRTPYVLGALHEARARGALTVALVCNAGTPAAAAADLVIAPLVGPEVLAGSTRLKAGTATKLVCNMLSTAVMVQLGKCYGNLMVDVQASNAKLRARARRIVAAATGLDDGAAAKLLARCGGEVKTAIVAARRGLEPHAARAALAAHGGVVRAALGEG